MCYVKLSTNILSEWGKDAKREFQFYMNLCLKPNTMLQGLHRFVTNNKKWVLHPNKKQKSQRLLDNERPLPKQSQIFINKSLCFVFSRWNIKGIVYYELLEHKRIINAGVYCKEFDRLNKHLCPKWSALLN